jgi:hypothetical protein
MTLVLIVAFLSEEWNFGGRSRGTKTDVWERICACNVKSYEPVKMNSGKCILLIGNSMGRLHRFSGKNAFPPKEGEPPQETGLGKAFRRLDKAAPCAYSLDVEKFAGKKGESRGGAGPPKSPRFSKGEGS